MANHSSILAWEISWTEESSANATVMFAVPSDTGTIFLPTENLAGKKRWIAYATNVLGQIIVNEGAKKALVEKDSSLLPIGVVEVRNDFRRGDVVSIIDAQGVEFARGVVNYNFSDAQKIVGVHSDEILKTLGYKNYDALITRDNIVLL